MKKNISRAPAIWGLIVVVVAISVFVYLIRDDKPATESIIPLKSYADVNQVALSVSTKLQKEISENKFYWIGVEPGKSEQIDLAVILVSQINKSGTIKKIFIDQELGLKKNELSLFGQFEAISFKENVYKVGEKLKQYETNATPYILITASIYTTSILKKNPFDILNQNFQIQPLKFSLAYFPLNLEDEKNFLFPCSTEDHTGTSEWGCLVLNKSRFSRRKISTKSQSPWWALLDSTSSYDYILLIRKI